MDKLAKRLREDADLIDVSISPEMETRIRASIAGVRPETPRVRAESVRPPWFWWASSLTGFAAAAAVVLIVNLRGPGEIPPRVVQAPSTIDVPVVEWRLRPAVLTSPLEEEYADLQADLRKAEQLLRQDIEALF
jgi:hypothetical protein